MTAQRPDRRAESFERLFSEYVAHHQSPTTGFVMPRLAHLILRRRGIALLSSRGAILTGVVSASVALGIPLVLTGLVGQWAEAPVARWVMIALAMGLLDAWTVAGWAQPTRSLNAVLHTIERESDLRRVLIFCRRWYRPR